MIYSRFVRSLQCGRKVKFVKFTFGRWLPLDGVVQNVFHLFVQDVLFSPFRRYVGRKVLRKLHGVCGLSLLTGRTHRGSCSRLLSYG